MESRVFTRSSSTCSRNQLLLNSPHTIKSTHATIEHLQASLLFQQAKVVFDIKKSPLPHLHLRQGSSSGVYKWQQSNAMPSSARFVGSSLSTWQWWWPPFSYRATCMNSLFLTYISGTLVTLAILSGKHQYQTHTIHTAITTVGCLSMWYKLACSP